MKEMYPPDSIAQERILEAEAIMDLIKINIDTSPFHLTESNIIQKVEFQEKKPARRFIELTMTYKGYL